jgi:protein-S-isoprenylcysteine O-methyltransferase Ste14
LATLGRLQFLFQLIRKTMKKSWNWTLWVGFLLVLVGFFSYAFFVLFPATRDFPWVNLTLFCLGGILLVVGLARAFGRPQVFRGKIFGPILAVIGLLVVGLFAYGVFYEVRQMPASAGAPRIGESAPEFTLPDQDAKPVALSDILRSSQAAVLIFYRGHW